jgi:hypothetical protein
MPVGETNVVCFLNLELMVLFSYPPVFKYWFEIYRSIGCAILTMLGAYTMWMTVGRNRCISLGDESEPILDLVVLGHYFAAAFFIVDMLVLLLVKRMYRFDLFLHHCICLFLLGYFTVDFPLVGSIFYVGESLTILNWLRPSYPIAVTIWRLAVVLFVRFPVFGHMFIQIAWADPFCTNHFKSKPLAIAMCFFFLYDIYVVHGCIQAIHRETKTKKEE